MRNKRRSSTITLGSSANATVVHLDPQSVENARTWSELWMTYRGFMFRGDQLLKLRSTLMESMFAKMRGKYPLNSNIFGTVDKSIEKLIKKMQTHSKKRCPDKHEKVNRATTKFINV